VRSWKDSTRLSSNSAWARLEGERLDALFTGKAVTIRKDTDPGTAARFEIAFKRAGARLRVVPAALMAAPPPEASPAPAPEQSIVPGRPTVPERPQETDTAAEADSGFRLAPVGVMLGAPRPVVPAPAVDLSHLTLAALGTVLGTPRPMTTSAPDTSHLSVAAAGVDLGVPALPVAAMDAPEWEVADVGVDLMPPSPDIEPEFDFDAIDFDLSPAGTLLMDVDDTPPPAPPDTSHLRME
jgi:hypothetical protein